MAISHSLVRGLPAEFLDGARRIRTSANHILLTSQFNWDKLPLIWEESTATGGMVTHLPLESSLLLSVTSSVGSRVVMQTKRYWLYRAGQAQHVQYTFAGMNAEAGVRKRAGYFDAANGLFIEVTDSDVAFVRRSSVSGSVVDTRVVQSSWNKDTLDGNGPSGVELDWSKGQLPSIDFQWFGTGPVLLSFRIDGMSVFAHEFAHTNSLDKVYMSTGSLPLRYEIECVDTGGSGGSFRQICQAVVREGGTEEHGVPAVVSTGFDVGSGIPATVGTSATSVIALRLRSSHIRAFLQPSTVQVLGLGYADALFWRVVLNGTFTGSFTWADAGSASQKSVSALAYTEGTGHVLASGFLPLSTAAAQEQSFSLSSLLGVAANIAGTSDILSLVVQSLAGTQSLAAAFEYLEVY